MSFIGRKIAHEHRSVVSLMAHDCEMMIDDCNRLHGRNGIEVSRTKRACFAEASAIQAATTICREYLGSYLIVTTLEIKGIHKALCDPRVLSFKWISLSSNAMAGLNWRCNDSGYSNDSCLH